MKICIYRTVHNVKHIKELKPFSFMFNGAIITFCIYLLIIRINFTCFSFFPRENK